MATPLTARSASLVAVGSLDDGSISVADAAPAAGSIIISCKDEKIDDPLSTHKEAVDR